jgi:GT2 family glycosyltransferase
MISVVIPNYNGVHYLEPCLSSVLAQDSAEQTEIILVDNGSSDGSAEFVSGRFPAVRVLSNATNTGFAGAVNQGIAAARGEWLLLLNNDTVMRPGALGTLRDRLEALGSDMAGVQPLLLSVANPELIDSAGIAVGPHFAARDDRHGQPRENAPGGEVEVFGVCFACALLRRAVFERCGLLDPDFFAEWDDVDFCLRAHWHGYRFLLIPQAEVLHHRSPTSQRDPDAKFMRRRRNQVLTMIKGLPAGRAWSQTLYRLQKDAFSLFHFLRERRLKMVVRSWIEVARLMPVMLERRRANQCDARLTAREMRPLLRGFETHV